MSGVLISSLAASGLYAIWFCNRPSSLTRVTVKTLATALLTLWAYLAGGPVLLVAALAFSTLGDALLGAGEERFLLGGMAAFFAAHVAYIAIFWPLAEVDRSGLILALQLILTFGGAFYLRSLLPYIEKGMRWPVLGYGAIILIMGNAALRLEPDLWLVTLGAMAFTLSDLILAFELFRMPKQDSRRWLTARLVWILYYGGQLAIAYGLVFHLAG